MEQIPLGKHNWVSAMSLGDMFDQTAQSFTGDALVMPDERITYPDLAELSNRYARALMGLGVGRNEKVGILMPAGIDYMALLLAIFKAGAVAVPINSRFKERELKHVVPTSDIKVLITNSDTKEFIDYAALFQNTFPAYFDPCSSAPKGIPELAHVVCLSNDSPQGFLSRGDFDRAAENVTEADLLRRRIGVRIRDTAVLMFTSGTTAQPKAAMLSHESLYRVVIALRDTRFIMTSVDRAWTALPLFHIGGITFGLICFAAGAAYCHSGFFNPSVSLQQLAREKCTVAIPSFETIWLTILNLPEFSDADLSAIRLIQCLGQPETLRRMQAVFPNAVQISSSGSTEASSYIALNLPSDPLEARLHTCGPIMPGLEIRIVDTESGEDLGPNQRGEVLLRGPQMFDGYYKEPELTKQSIDQNGWFHSGDLGELDQEGRFVFKGRLKDMLKVGGENVAAVEVEAYLTAHPAVMLASVVSAPDSRYVEVPAAFIQLRPGASATEEEIISFCLGQLATFKVPRYVRFVTEWPMSGTKIQKFVLRDQIADELLSAGITEAPKLQSRAANTGER